MRARILDRFISLRLCFLLLLKSFYESLVFPNAARIIFRARNDRISFIVECARENFVFVTFTRICSKALNLITGFCAPKSASLVAGGSDDLISLWVKLDFTDFVLVTLKDGGACSCEYIVDSRHAISTCCRQLITCLVEASIENFVSVTAELFNALASANILEASSSVDTSGEAVVSGEVKLAA